MLRQLRHVRYFAFPAMRILCTFLKGSQRNLLLAKDFEEGIQPRELKKVRHSLVDLDKLHHASPLPDDAIASDQLAHAVAVYVIHSGEIDQEFLVAGVAEDVYQVTQLRATIAQREFANSVNYNDPVELSCGDLKTHGDLAGLCFPARNYTSRGLSTSLRRLFAPEGDSECWPEHEQKPRDNWQEPVSIYLGSRARSRIWFKYPT